MSKDLEIAVVVSGDVTIINLDGDLTAVTGQAVENAYTDAVGSGSQKILFQFHENIYVNSGGIAFLIGIAADSRDNGRKVRFSGVSEHFQKIFDMVGLTRYVEIFPTTEAALEGF